MPGIDTYHVSVLLASRNGVFVVDAFIFFWLNILLCQLKCLQFRLKS